MDNITHVTVVPTDKLIIVNGQALRFDFELVEGHEHMHALQYNGTTEQGHIEFTDDYNHALDASLYDEEVKPYVDAWEAEKARLDAEAAAAEAEYNSLPNVQARKLSQLNADLNTLFSKGHLTSSLGFEVNADEAANRNITGLITSMESSNADTVAFMGYDNVLHMVSLEDLKTMQLELIQFAQDAYARKWTLRSKIEACTSKEQIDAITWDEMLNETTVAA